MIQRFIILTRKLCVPLLANYSKIRPRSLLCPETILCSSPRFLDETFISEINGTGNVSSASFVGGNVIPWKTIVAEHGLAGPFANKERD